MKYKNFADRVLVLFAVMLVVTGCDFAGDDKVIDYTPKSVHEVLIGILNTNLQATWKDSSDSLRTARACEQYEFWSCSSGFMGGSAWAKFMITDIVHGTPITFQYPKDDLDRENWKGDTLRVTCTFENYIAYDNPVTVNLEYGDIVNNVLPPPSGINCGIRK